VPIDSKKGGEIYEDALMCTHHTDEGSSKFVRTPDSHLATTTPVNGVKTASADFRCTEQVTCGGSCIRVWQIIAC